MRNPPGSSVPWSGKPTDPDDGSQAIEALVDDWAGVILRAARRFGLTASEHDELVQEVRLRVWRALEKRAGKADELLHSYGYAAAVSAAIDLVRKRRPSRGATVLPLETVQDRLASEGPGPDESELVSQLEAGLAALDPPRRVAVQLHLRGRSLEEISRISGWTSAKARNLLYRGLDDLRHAVQTGATGA